MLDGWTPGISLVRWMSITSERSLARLAVLAGVLVRDPASWSRRASGRVERSESSKSISSSSEDIEEPDTADDLRRRFVGRDEGCAHSGTGFKRSNCLRSRFVYSLPLTMSSLSLTRNFRDRAFPAREIANRSSSLSSQAGASPPSSSSDPIRGINAFESIVGGPESRKKS
jgi:hypothetical protein